MNTKNDRKSWQAIQILSKPSGFEEQLETIFSLKKFQHGKDNGFNPLGQSLYLIFS
jgi:hypothetical protein